MGALHLSDLPSLQLSISPTINFYIFASISLTSHLSLTPTLLWLIGTGSRRNGWSDQISKVMDISQKVKIHANVMMPTRKQCLRMGINCALVLWALVASHGQRQWSWHLSWTRAAQSYILIMSCAPKLPQLDNCNLIHNRISYIRRGQTMSNLCTQQGFTAEQLDAGKIYHFKWRNWTREFCKFWKCDEFEQSVWSFINSLLWWSWLEHGTAYYQHGMHCAT